MSSEGQGDDAGQAVGEIAEGAGELAELVSKASEGDAAGALESGLGAVGSVAGIAGSALGEDEAEAREALSTVQTVANAAGAAVGAGQTVGRALETGNASQALGGAGGATDAARYVVPDHEAQEALSGAGQVARGAQSALSSAADLAGGGFGAGGEMVEFHLDVSGADDQWTVRHVALAEQLNGVPRCAIEARYTGHVEATELLRKEVQLSVERPGHRRDFKGIVWVRILWRDTQLS
jgi:hypothetical protein